MADDGLAQGLLVEQEEHTMGDIGNTVGVDGNGGIAGDFGKGGGISAQNGGMALHGLDERDSKAFKQRDEGKGESGAHEPGEFIVAYISGHNDIPVVLGCSECLSDATGLPGQSAGQQEFVWGATLGFKAIESSDEAFNIFSGMHGPQVEKVRLSLGVFIPDELLLGDVEWFECRIASVAGNENFIGVNMILLLNIGGGERRDGDNTGGVLEELGNEILVVLPHQRRNSLGEVEVSEVMCNDGIGELSAEGGKAIGGEEAISPIFMESVGYCPLEPGVPEEGMPGRWKKNDRLHVICGDKAGIEGAVKEEEKLMFGMSAHQFAGNFPGKSTNTLHAAREQEAGIDSDAHGGVRPLRRLCRVRVPFLP